MPGIETTDAVGRLGDGLQSVLGAVFLTYTFDAIFFEEEILATLLPLREDPAEATRRFLEEGRRKLVETPVLVIADPGMLRGGQRLPYDLIRADPARTFHPKLALVLHGAGARLVVGSGNLTPGGYGDNSELSARLDLDYQADAALLRQVVGFAESCGARGEAWGRLLAELVPRLGPEQPASHRPPSLLHTHGTEPLLDAFLAWLPEGATIERIGVLAPFHQEDGAPPEAALLDRLLDATQGRRARDFVLDVGVSWEGNPVGPGQKAPGALDAHTGELWGWLEGAVGKETVGWFILGKHVERSFEVDYGHSTGWRSTRELNALRTEARAWPVGDLVAFAPEELVQRAAARVPVRIWLHPEVHRREGRIYRQPLHGKLLTVAVREGKARRTWLLVGSPNASAAALLRPDGNVECTLVLVVEGHHHLGTLCERLVPVPLRQVSLRGRTFTPPASSPARWVEDAVYDAAARSLVVRWRPVAPPLSLWYPTPIPRLLLDGTPRDPSLFAGLTLDPGCCELEVRDPATGASGRVPIRVVNALQLPVEGLSGDLALDELLLLHSGGVSPAGIAARRLAGAGGDGAEGAAAVFGDALTPREIFRAILSIGDELRGAASLSAYQAQLLGLWGVRRLAERIAEAPERGELMITEAWVYGAELARVLEGLRFDGDPTGPARDTLRDDLAHWIWSTLPDPAADTPGLEHLRRFYLGETP